MAEVSEAGLFPSPLHSRDLQRMLVSLRLACCLPRSPGGSGWGAGDRAAANPGVQGKWDFGLHLEVGPGDSESSEFLGAEVTVAFKVPFNACFFWRTEGPEKFGDLHKTVTF